MAQYHLPVNNTQPFARTNIQTIRQRVNLIRELLPQIMNSIAELCCSDCLRQWHADKERLGIKSFHSLDLCSEIVATNQAQGIDCVCDQLRHHS